LLNLFSGKKAKSTLSKEKDQDLKLIRELVEKGYIESVYQSIFDYLPDHQQYKNDDRENITIEHLLTM
jgi:hypothetical protein